VGLAALAAFVAIVYWPGLTGPFLFDDFPALVDNGRVHVTELSWSALWNAAVSFDPGGTGRQLAMLSFALNHALGGLDPWGWKLGGLLVHLLNTLLIYAFSLRVLRLSGVHAYLGLSAAAIAALWAVHPLQISSVLYVVQRMETLCLSFMLLALLAYLQGRQVQMAGGKGWPWLVGCALMAVLALGCKETALLLPVYTLCLELVFLKFAGATAGQRRFWRWGYGAGCVLAVLVFIAAVIPNYGAPENYTIRNFTAWERVLTQLRVLPLYLAQILMPVPKLMPFYYDDYVASRSLIDPWTTAAGGALLASLLAVAWRARVRAPLLALGILWFFASHAITSNVVALELVFEHRNYFALLGVLFALAELVRHIPVRDGPAIKVVAVVAIILGVGALGMIRSAIWGSGLLLVTEQTSLNPNSARAAQGLATIYNTMSDGSPDSPFFSLAVKELERESAMPHASLLGEQSLILLHAEHGLPVKKEWWERMQWRLRERPISRESVAGLFDLLKRRLNGVEMDDAALGDSLQLLVVRHPLPAQGYVVVAVHALKYRNDPDLAEALLRRALNLNTSDEFRGQLLGQLVMEGYPDLASKLSVNRAPRQD